MQDFAVLCRPGSSEVLFLPFDVRVFWAVDIYFPAVPVVFDVYISIAARDLVLYVLWFQLRGVLASWLSLLY